MMLYCKFVNQNRESEMSSTTLRIRKKEKQIASREIKMIGNWDGENENWYV